MPPYTGFVGESYPAASVWERSVTKNWILEKNESETARSPYTLVPTEGLTLATSVSPAPIKALFEQNGRVFFVAAAGFYELTYDSGTGTYTATSRGTLAVDGNPATICANGPSGGQLFITAGDVGYCFVLATNTLTTVVASGAAMGASIDGRFHVLDSSTGIVSFSALLDGTSWPGANVYKRSADGDPAIAMTVTPDGLIRLLGSRTGEAWADVGGSFPYELVKESRIPFGIAAPFAFAVDTSITWVTSTAKGRGQVVRAQGYTPVRVSNHGIEHELQSYAVIDDARGFAYQSDGHSFAVFTFPTADTTWVVDGATGKWHERAYWNSTTGRWHAYRPSCAVNAFGTTLVGDGMTGAIYELSASTFTDVDGSVVRRVRQPAPLSLDRQRVIVDGLEILLDVGVGLATGTGSDPQATLEISRDGGHTFGHRHTTAIGPIGAFDTRALFTRLGAMRSITPRLTIADPVAARVTGAVVQLRGGTS